MLPNSSDHRFLPSRANSRALVAARAASEIYRGVALSTEPLSPGAVSADAACRGAWRVCGRERHQACIVANACDGSSEIGQKARPRRATLVVKWLRRGHEGCWADASLAPPLASPCRRQAVRAVLALSLCALSTATFLFVCARAVWRTRLAGASARLPPTEMRMHAYMLLCVESKLRCSTPYSPSHFCRISPCLMYPVTKGATSAQMSDRTRMPIR
eukprot:6192924-Pleurochrysis_carterae.AAC.1